MAYSKQQYRIYIAGHSWRHVFGASTASEITDWLVGLAKGEKEFPKHSDWSVERRTFEGEWVSVYGKNLNKLKQAIQKKLDTDD